MLDPITIIAAIYSKYPQAPWDVLFLGTLCYIVWRLDKTLTAYEKNMTEGMRQVIEELRKPHERM